MKIGERSGEDQAGKTDGELGQLELANAVTGTKFRDKPIADFVEPCARKFEPVTTIAEPAITTVGG